MSNALVMKGGDPNLGELNVGTSNAAHAEQLSKAVGAPKSIRNKISNAAASLKSGASKLGKWISNTWMGRNAAGNSRWTRYGRKFMGRNAAGNSRWTRYGRAFKGRLEGIGTTLRRFGSRFANRFRKAPSAAGLFGNNNLQFEPPKKNSARRSSRRGSRRSRR